MRIVNTVKVSMRALRRNLMRSVLTALGIIIGVGAVIAMVSIGNGAKAQIEGQVASLGQNVITVFPGSFTSVSMARRTLPSAEERSSTMSTMTMAPST